MVRSKEISEYGNKKEVCLDEVLRKINNLIMAEGITKSNIIEYQTTIEFNSASRDYRYHCKVIISWWK